MMTHSLLDELFAQKKDYLEIPTESDWRRSWNTLMSVPMPPAHLSARGGALSDRLAWVFMSGYQGAMRQSFPDCPATGWSAFLVSEDRHNPDAHPPVKLTENGETLSLSGWKSWVAGAQHVDDLVIKVGRGEQRQFLWLNRNTAGIVIDVGKPPKFLPELGQGLAEFQATPVPRSQIITDISGAMAFGQIEALHILAALTAFLLSHSVRLRMPVTIVDRAAMLLNSLVSLSENFDNSAAFSDSAQLCLAATERQLQILADNFEAELPSRDETLLNLWLRDRSLVTIYSRIIQQRGVAAYDALVLR